MEKYPKISIITPSYNQGQYIEETILSVIGQNYPNIEYIIIDGESTDNTVEIIKKYQEYLAYWVSEPDKGIYDAMNKGIAKATGEWLYFLGTDDILCENILVKFFEKKDYEGINFLYGNVVLKHSRQVLGKQKNAHSILFSTICHQACFYKKQLFNEIGTYDTRYKYISDWIFNIHILLSNSNDSLYFANEVAIYNELGASGTNNLRTEINLLYRDIINTLDISSFYKKLLLPIENQEITNNFKIKKGLIDKTLFIEKLFEIKLNNTKSWFKKLYLSFHYILHKPRKSWRDYKILFGDILFKNVYKVLKKQKTNISNG